MHVTVDVNSGWIRATVQIRSPGGSMIGKWYSPFMLDRQSRKEAERRRVEGVERNRVKRDGAWPAWVKEQFDTAEEHVNKFNDDMSIDLRSSGNPVVWQPLKFLRQSAEFFIEDARASFYIRVLFDNNTHCVTVKTNMHGDECSKYYELTMRDTGLEVRALVYCDDGKPVDLIAEVLIPAFTRASGDV